MAALLLGRIAKEGANAGKLARGRGSAEPLPSPVGQERAKVRGTGLEQALGRNFLSTIAAEEVDQPVRGGDIGAHGMRRTAPVMLKIRTPLRRERLGGVNYGCGCISHLRIIAARVRPRNISNSDP